MKFNVLSGVCFGLFVMFFYAIMNGMSFGAFGRAVIIVMVILPLIGLILAFKGQKGGSKWLLLLANSIAFLTVGYLLLLSRMGEA